MAKRFPQSRAAVLCHIMKWRLNRVQTGPPDQGDAQGAVRHLSRYVDSALSERMEGGHRGRDENRSMTALHGAPDDHYGFACQLAGGKIGGMLP
jgi:hypothetical protein